MSRQKIELVDNGAKSMRVLDALTPVNGSVAPAVNAEFLGQIYVDEVSKSVYISTAVGSTVKANDWDKMVPTRTIMPLSGAGVPTINATFLGQLYIDSTNANVYVAVAVGSTVKINDWQKVTPTPAG